MRERIKVWRGVFGRWPLVMSDFYLSFTRKEAVIVSRNLPPSRLHSKPLKRRRLQKLNAWRDPWQAYLEIEKNVLATQQPEPIVSKQYTFQKDEWEYPNHPCPNCGELTWKTASNWCPKCEKRQKRIIKEWNYAHAR